MIIGSKTRLGAFYELVEERMRSCSMGDKRSSKEMYTKIKRTLACIALIIEKEIELMKIAS